MSVEIYRFDEIELDKLELVETDQDMGKVRYFAEILNKEPDYEFPPIVCSQDKFDKKFYIKDGHHRVLAYIMTGRKTIQAEMTVWSS